MQVARPCRRGSRVSAETRKTVRAYYRNVLRVALAVVALFALYAGEQAVADGWAPVASLAPHASGRDLLAAHSAKYSVPPGCDSNFPDESARIKAEAVIATSVAINVTREWQSSCCRQPPASKAVLKQWWTACQNTEFLMGNHYLACLEKWYDDAVKCTEGVDYAPTNMCSLKMHCSDMGMYQSFGMVIGPAGFNAGMTVPYICFLLYLFVGLAIVCDEYFVPAIDEISEVWNITPDVAGATLMAAGGSAPELATSFMGVFVSKSNVGFSTIVGSAVFNVLFVIGACAFASKDMLKLSAWPLARDCSYYAMTLTALALVYNFGPSAPGGGGTIEWYEALIMLGFYVGYVTLMKFNEPLQAAFKKAFSKAASVAPEDGAENGGVTKEDKEDDVKQHWTGFRIGILDVIMKSKPLDNVLGLHVVHKVSGDVKSTFDQIDKDNSGYIDSEELVQLLRDILQVEPSKEQIESAMTSLVTNNDDDHGGEGKVSFEEFSNWYTKSELSVEAEMNVFFNKMDDNNSGSITADDFKKLCADFRGDQKISEEEMKKALEMMKKGENNMSMEEFGNWYKSTAMYKERVENAGAADEEEESEGASLAFPEDLQGRFWYIVLFPLTASLFFSVPDVRWKNGWEKWYLVTFFMSIVWIAIYAFFMVWIAIAMGDNLGIPQSVMGLTILAMGTSVPDMISSVIVTLHGEGDMAVSSSIGSNIFDIGLGLPLPWILGCAVYGRGIELGAGCGTIFIDLLLLLAMVVAVVLTVHFSGWQLSKPLGIVMFSLYFVFITQSLLRTFLVSTC